MSEGVMHGPPAGTSEQKSYPKPPQPSSYTCSESKELKKYNKVAGPCRRQSGPGHSFGRVSEHLGLTHSLDTLDFSILPER